MREEFAEINSVTENRRTQKKGRNETTAEVSHSQSTFGGTVQPDPIENHTIQQHEQQNEKPTSRRGSYDLSRYTKTALKQLDFWEELLDGLRSFDDDCSILEKEWLERTKADKILNSQWRQRMSVRFCQYYRKRIVKLLINMESVQPDCIPNDHANNICRFQNLIEQLKTLKQFSIKNRLKRA